MSTTQGTTDYQYCSIPGGTPKAVNVLADVICSPRIDVGLEERKKFVEFLDNYIEE